MTSEEFTAGVWRQVKRNAPPAALGWLGGFLTGVLLYGV